MHVKPKDPKLVYKIREALFTTIEKSRFRLRPCDIQVEGKEVTIKCVRLREKSDYCGQHPGPCIFNPFAVERPHRKTTYLQGADWVGFNRLINDLFDKKSWEADVWSYSMEFRGKMRIRLGHLRRMVYQMSYFNWNHPVWDAPGNEEDFENWCGKKAPAEEYPAGTPGTPAWKVKRTRKRV